MNRIAIILSALMCLTLSVGAKNSVWMNDFYLHTGETARIPIMLSSETTLKSVQCDIKMPGWCDETNTSFTLGGQAQNGSIAIQRPEVDVVRLLITANNTLAAGTGEIAYLNIEAPIYLKDSYLIHVKDIKLINRNGTAMTASNTRCIVNPPVLQRGDVTADRIIDVEDVNKLINYVLNFDRNIDLGQCDLNYDGTIDVEDLNIVINAILGLDKVSRPYVASLKDLQQMLNNAYVTNNYAFLELCTDNLVDNQAPDKNGNQYWLDAYSVNDSILFSWGVPNVSDNNDTPENLWKSCYAAINECNVVLNLLSDFDGVLDGNIDTDDERLYCSIKGEALVSRAYHHWLLANVFCMPWAGNERSATLPGVPYMLEPGDPVADHVGRGTLLQTYELIEQDLREGIAELPHNADVYQWPCYHFTTKSAHAFAAKFYLAKRDYIKAKAYATLVFDGAEPELNPIWRATNLYYGADHVTANCSPDNPAVLLSMPTYSTWSRRPGGRYGCKDDALRATIQGPGPSWENYRWRNSRGETFSQHPCYQGKLFVFGSQDYGYSFYANWGELFEYTDKLAGIGYVHMIRNEFTVEETLLVRAEAEIFLYERDAALADLKMWVDNRIDCLEKPNMLYPFSQEVIENFYNSAPQSIYAINKPMHIDEVCPSSKYQVTEEMLPWLQCVQHFQRIETVHTGKRWFDIKRYGLEIEHVVGSVNGTTSDTLTLSDKRRAIQIPASAIEAGMQPNAR